MCYVVPTDDIMAKTNLNDLETMCSLILFIKAVTFEYYAPSVSGVDCCASVPRSRNDSFSQPWPCVYVL